MALDGCGLVCKFFLVLFNVIFALVGLAFLSLGLWLRFSENTRPIFNIEELNSSTFVIAVTVLIVLGTIMLIVVTFGDYGACSEKRGALQVFSCLVALLAGAEICVGVLAYSYREKVGVRLGELYSNIYTIYAATGDAALAVTLLFIHNWLHCCGVTGIKLIETVKDTCPSPRGFLEHIAMPSCPVTIMGIFESKAFVMLCIFIGTGALLITALICSIVLLQQLKKVNQAINSYYSAVY
uniref:Tetraspanin n=1 Tax=Nothobranchius kadleci TaxID=1051664 RepID=A0A1A8DK37_NOTKA